MELIIQVCVGNSGEGRNKLKVLMHVNSIFLRPSIYLDSDESFYVCVCVLSSPPPPPLSLFFFWEAHFNKTNAFLVGPVYCSMDPQTSFFNKTFIKNRSHDTIHTFKNYFITVFSVFSKISGIQTHPKCTFTPKSYKQIVFKIQQSLSIYRRMFCSKIMKDARNS